MAADFVRAARRGDCASDAGGGSPRRPTRRRYRCSRLGSYLCLPPSHHAEEPREVPHGAQCLPVSFVPLSVVRGTRSVARSVNDACAGLSSRARCRVAWMRRCVASRGWDARGRVTAHGAPARLPSPVNNGEGQIYQRVGREDCLAGNGTLEPAKLEGAPASFSHGDEGWTDEAGIHAPQDPRPRAPRLIARVCGRDPRAGCASRPHPSRPDGAPRDLTIKISIAHRPSHPSPCPPFDDRLARRCVERARWR